MSRCSTAPRTARAGTTARAGALYKQQADDVLAVSANLSEEQKLLAELFDHKFRSLGGAAMAAIRNQNMTIMELVHMEFVLNMAAFDAGIAIWQEKTKWNAVRPFTAVAKLYPDTCDPAARLLLPLLMLCSTGSGAS